MTPHCGVHQGAVWCCQVRKRHGQRGREREGAFSLIRDIIVWCDDDNITECDLWYPSPHHHIIIIRVTGSIGGVTAFFQSHSPAAPQWLSCQRSTTQTAGAPIHFYPSTLTQPHSVPAIKPKLVFTRTKCTVASFFIHIRVFSIRLWCNAK